MGFLEDPSMGTKPLPYTGNPLELLWNDVLLFFQITLVWPPTAGIPSIVLPVWPFRSKELCELYPSLQNLKAILLHVFLIFTQTLFILSIIPFAFIGVPIPFHLPIWLAYIIGFVVANWWVSALLNGQWNKERKFYAGKQFEGNQEHEGEKWVFINGVAAGEHWLQSNLERLARTFRRPIVGIHNQTRGIIFDVLECMIQRCFNYATNDIREAYEELASVLSDSAVTKVVLIVHSQGAIEGGIVLDWLFATLPSAQVSKLEVYTFGNAANHWNSPLISVADNTGRIGDIAMDPPQRVIKHIEHYANTGDYVSRFGILHFRPQITVAEQSTQKELEPTSVVTTTAQEKKFMNRFVGRLFKREGSGHQFNGNYLDNMFVMNENLTKVLEENEFMDTVINEEVLKTSNTVIATGIDTERKMFADARRVKDISRLWLYRNGLKPAD